MKNNKTNRGITIIALVITIIILLILATITIQTISGQNGLINKMSTVKKKHKIGEEKDILSISYSSEYIYSKENGTEISKENLEKEINKNGKNAKVEDSETDSSKLIVIFKDTGNVYEVDKLTGETKHLGSYEGGYKEPELKEGDIKFSSVPDYYTNNNVLTEINVNKNVDMTNYTLKYSKDLKNWYPYTGAILSEKNEIITAKIEDNITKRCILSATQNILQIDKLEPNAAAMLTVKTSSLKVDVNAADQEKTEENACSGIKGYYYSINNGEYSSLTQNSSYTFEKLKQNTDFVINVKIEDAAGNVTILTKNAKTGKIPEVSSGNLNYTVTWIGTNAKLDFKTDSDLRIELSTDIQKWDISDTITVPSNTMVYARLTDETNVSSNYISVLPLWTGTVTYDANGGYNPPMEQKAGHTSTVNINFTPPTRTNYEFLGWSTNSFAVEPEYTATGTNSFVMGTNNVRLYAIWKLNNFTVSYNANGGTGAPGNQIKKGGETLMLSSIKPTKANSVFLGWTARNGSNTVDYAAGASYTNDSDVVLYAVWHTHIDTCYSTACTGTFTATNSSEVYYTDSHVHTGNSTNGGGCYQKANTTYVTCGGKISEHTSVSTVGCPTTQTCTGYITLHVTKTTTGKCSHGYKYTNKSGYLQCDSCGTYGAGTATSSSSSCPYGCNTISPDTGRCTATVTCSLCNGKGYRTYYNTSYICDVCGTYASSGTTTCTAQRGITTYSLNCGKNEGTNNCIRTITTYKCNTCGKSFVYKPAASQSCNICGNTHSVGSSGTTTSTHNAITKYLNCKYKK